MLIKQHGINLNIELKVEYGEQINALCAAVTHVIKSTETPEEQLLFSSFNMNVLHTLKNTIPSIRRSPLWQKMPTNGLSILADLQAFSMNCDYRFITKEQIKEVKQAGYQIHCYTLNFPELAQPLISYGIDNIITDRPQDY